MIWADRSAELSDKSEISSDTSEESPTADLSDSSALSQISDPGLFQIFQRSLQILFGEFTLSDSIINASTANSLLRNSATF